MLLNCDKSVVKLNVITEPFGYTLKFYSLKELQENFASFFGWLEENTSNPFDHIEVTNYGIKSGFYNALVQYFGYSIGSQEGIVMIKSQAMSHLIKKNKTIRVGENWGEVAGSFQRFTGSLILQLRLFKTGPIMTGSQFEIRKVDRRVYSKIESKKTELLSNGLYIMSSAEIDLFKECFNPSFKINELCKLAFDSFELAYRLENLQTRFVTLMTALESLFNQGRDQITHIVSRHLALIVANDKVEFQEHYKAIKKLYGIRSAIVHGQGFRNDSLMKDCNILEEYVRRALNYCLKLDLDMTRRELFEELNANGY